MAEDRLKICHVITSLVYAGAERLLVNFANIHAEDHDVDVIYFKGEPQLVPAFDPRIRVHHFPLEKGTAKRVRAFLQDGQFDVVHTHLGHADFVGLWAARGLPMRKFCTMHNIWFKWNWRDHLFFAGYRLLFNRFVADTHVISISSSVAEHVEGRLRVPADRSTIVYNGIPEITLDADRDALRAELDIPADRFAVLFVGRLRIQKSVDTLIRAAAELRSRIPGLLVLIVGEGPEREKLDALCDELGVQDVVRFCGVTETPERYFAAADAFALPSVFEGFGLVLLESFRAAVPAVSTNIEGPRELIEDGANGLLVPPENPTALAGAIARLHDEPELRTAIGSAGYERYQDHFTIRQYARNLEALYRGQPLPSGR